MSMAGNLSILLVFLVTLFLNNYSCFYIDILNITTCKKESNEELGELKGKLIDRYPFDQTYTGTLTIPFDLDDDARLTYLAWNLDLEDNEWKVLYEGGRSLCYSLMKSSAYQDLADTTSLPADCPIREGTYELDDIPISGQYVVFSSIKGLSSLVRHKLILSQDKQIILCRIIFTMSHEI